jgi:hypothetical protein
MASSPVTRPGMSYTRRHSGMAATILSELTPVRSDLFQRNRPPSIGPPRSRIKASETDKIAPTPQGRCGRPPVARHGARLDRREQATSRLAGCGFALLEWRKLFLALLHFTLRERGNLGGHLLHVDMFIRYFFEGCGWVCESHPDIVGPTCRHPLRGLRTRKCRSCPVLEPSDAWRHPSGAFARSSLKAAPVTRLRKIHNLGLSITATDIIFSRNHKQSNSLFYLIRWRLGYGLKWPLSIIELKSGNLYRTA